MPTREHNIKGTEKLVYLEHIGSHFQSDQASDRNKWWNETMALRSVVIHLIHQYIIPYILQILYETVNYNENQIFTQQFHRSRYLVLRLNTNHFQQRLTSVIK